MRSGLLTPSPELAQRLGGCEIVGGENGAYEMQQDTLLVVQPEAKFWKVSGSTRAKLYQAAFASAAQQLKQGKGIWGGTTALVIGAHFAEEKSKRTLQLHSANLGDSAGFLIVYDAEGRINREKSRLLNAFHEPANTAERARIAEAGGKITRADEKGSIERLNGHLSCTGSIEGYDSRQLKGLRTEPEYLEDTVELAEGEQAMLVLGCDGMLDMLLIDQQIDTSTPEGRQTLWHLACRFIENTITPTELLSKEPQYLAAKLVKAASDSYDNISILIHKLTPKKPSLLLGVFDGHGKQGEVASARVAQVVGKALGQAYAMRKLLLVEPNVRSTASIDGYLAIVAFLEKGDSAKYTQIISDLHAELKTATDPENYSLVQNEIVEKFNEISTILKNEEWENEKKISEINTAITNFIAQMDEHVRNRPSFPKRVGVIACRLLGTLVGLLPFTIAVPFVITTAACDNALKDKSHTWRDYGKAFALGMGAFVVSTIASPFIAAYLGDSLIKEVFASHYQKKTAAKDAKRILGNSSLSLFNNKEAKDPPESAPGTDPATTPTTKK